MKKLGMTLIELLIVVTILTLTTLVLIPLATEGEHQGRIDATYKRAENIQRLFYQPSAPFELSAFISDMGRLPVLRNLNAPLAELYDATLFPSGGYKPQYVTTAPFVTDEDCPDLTTSVKCGWQGPYVDSEIATYDAWKDLWIPLDKNGNALQAIGEAIYGIKSKSADRVFYFLETPDRPATIEVNLSIIDPRTPKIQQMPTTDHEPVTNFTWRPNTQVTEGAILASDSGYIYRATARVSLEEGQEMYTGKDSPIFNTEYRTTTVDSMIGWEMIWPKPSAVTTTRCYLIHIDDTHGVLEPKGTLIDLKSTALFLLPSRYKICALSFVKNKKNQTLNIRYSDIVDIQLKSGHNIIEIPLIHQEY